MLTGLSAFPLTPYDDAGVVDADLMGRFVARLAGSGVSSIGVLGSTGSYMYLSSDQRERALRAAVEAAGDTPVLAGIGALRTSDVLTHAKAAEAAGAAAVLLAPVSYLPLTDADFSGLVRDVSSVCGLPICLYNNPGTTHFTMSSELVARLSQLPRVAAVKNPAPSSGGAAREQMDTLRNTTPKSFVLGYSGDAFIDNALSAGADAWYSVIAGTLPEMSLAIWNARQDPKRMEELHCRAAPLWELFKTHGGIRVVPVILELLGLGSAPLARPLLQLEKDVVAEIEVALDQLEGAAA